MKNDLVVIKCPCCGQEYLPSEIYSPKSFFGKPEAIYRTPDGAIDFYIGEDMDLSEQYICDQCGHTLSITARLAFNVTIEDTDESTEYVSKINKPDKLKLNEEELF